MSTQFKLLMHVLSLSPGSLGGLEETLVMIMLLSMLCPTYPKSGQVGDVVRSWYQDFVPRGGDFVLSLYFVILLQAM